MFKIFNREASAMTILNTDEEQQQQQQQQQQQERPQQWRGRHTNLGRKLGVLKRRLLHPDYYDPYQREQQTQDPWQALTTEKTRPIKRQRRSVTSTIIDGMVGGFHYGAAVAMSAYGLLRTHHAHKAITDKRTKIMRGRDVDFSLLFERPAAWEPRQQHVEKYIGQVCLKKQQEKQQKLSFHLPLIQEVHHQHHHLHHHAYEDDQERWGFIYKGDFEAHFPPLNRFHINERTTPAI